MEFKGNILAGVAGEYASYVTSTGSADAYAVTVDAGVTSYTAGLKIVFRANFQNTGAATLAVNGMTAKTIRKSVSTALANGDILNGQIVTVIFDGVNDWFQIQGGAGGGSGSSGTSGSSGNTGTSGSSGNTGNAGSSGSSGSSGNTGSSGTSGAGTISGTRNRLSKFTSTTAIGNTTHDDDGNRVLFGSQYGVGINAVTYGATTTVNWNTSNVAKVVMTGNITTLTLNNPVAGMRYMLILVHSGGARTVAWPATFRWSGGTAPTLSASGNTDIISLVWDGTQYFAGANLNFPAGS